MSSRFFSVTVRGYKYEKRAGCAYQGHRAIYLGPGKAFLDEEGHLFRRNEAIEVCTDSVAKFSVAPYDTMFAVLAPGEDRAASSCSATAGACC